MAPLAKSCLAALLVQGALALRSRIENVDKTKTQLPRKEDLQLDVNAPVDVDQILFSGMDWMSVADVNGQGTRAVLSNPWEQIEQDFEGQHVKARDEPVDTLDEESEDNFIWPDASPKSMFAWDRRAGETIEDLADFAPVPIVAAPSEDWPAPPVYGKAPLEDEVGPMIDEGIQRAKDSVQGLEAQINEYTRQAWDAVRKGKSAWRRSPGRVEVMPEAAKQNKTTQERPHVATTKEVPAQDEEGQEYQDDPFEPMAE